MNTPEPIFVDLTTKNTSRCQENPELLQRHSAASSSSQNLLSLYPTVLSKLFWVENHQAQNFSFMFYFGQPKSFDDLLYSILR